jgi:hypothetical protein
LECKVVDKAFGALHIYMEIVLYCSVLFYAALTEFVCGPVEREMTEGEASLGDMYYDM